MSVVVRKVQGQIAGALSRLDGLSTRMGSLAAVADDVASGVTPLDGIKANAAQALGMALSVEVEQLQALGEQLRTAYAYTLALSSSMPTAGEARNAH